MKLTNEMDIGAVEGGRVGMTGEKVGAGTVGLCVGISGQGSSCTIPNALNGLQGTRSSVRYKIAVGKDWVCLTDRNLYICKTFLTMNFAKKLPWITKVLDFTSGMGYSKTP